MTLFITHTISPAKVTTVIKRQQIEIYTQMVETVSRIIGSKSHPPVRVQIC